MTESHACEVYRQTAATVQDKIIYLLSDAEAMSTAVSCLD